MSRPFFHPPKALHEQRNERFVVDGEAVAFDGAVTSFSRLQQGRGRVYLHLFDVMHLGEHDMCDLPLRMRTSVLRDEFDFDDPIRFCPHRNGGDGTGAAWLAEACEKGWEGLIAERADSADAGGRSRDRLKLECVARQEFLIGGFTDPKGSRSGLGALLVGSHDDRAGGDRAGGALRFAGRVGTGFDAATLERLASLLGTRECATFPFAAAPTGSDVHWVTPDTVCQVGFTEWTAAGRFRHPRFHGRGDDKDPADVVRETPEMEP